MGDLGAGLAVWLKGLVHHGSYLDVEPTHFGRFHQTIIPHRRGRKRPELHAELSAFSDPP